MLLKKKELLPRRASVLRARAQSSRFSRNAMRGFSACEVGARNAKKISERSVVCDEVFNFQEFT